MREFRLPMARLCIKIRCAPDIADAVSTGRVTQNLHQWAEGSADYKRRQRANQGQDGRECNFAFMTARSFNARPM
jgi:hypothetical protein